MKTKLMFFVVAFYLHAILDKEIFVTRVKNACLIFKVTSMKDCNSPSMLTEVHLKLILIGYVRLERVDK